MEGASTETIRTRPLKIGALIQQSVRLVRVHVASGFPLRAEPVTRADLARTDLTAQMPQVSQRIDT
jgi:hypothetical protein